MYHINAFTKGCISDLDPSKVEGSYWTFDTLNIDVINKEGQGYIVSYSKGNSKVDAQGNLIGSGEEFVISTGFKILGACEYNGICYIASYNESTQEGEIGCYPSPNALDESLVPISPPYVYQFERKYKPLRNYTQTIDYNLFPNTPRFPFRTKLFNWDLERYVDMFAKESYDGSLDLYLCDYKNPNRVINTTFHNETGVVNNRLYFDLDFNGSINQVQSSFSSLQYTLSGIVTGGFNKCGIYFLFFRYLDASLNPTPFTLYTGPLQVYQGDVADLASVQGGADITDSHKKIVIDLSGVDTTYKWVEVAYVRFYSDASQVQVWDKWLLGHQWLIAGDTLHIEVLGNENLLVITESELIEKVILERTCRSHTQIGNRYWGANWKRTEMYNDGLKDFALTISTSYNFKSGFSTDTSRPAPVISNTHLGSLPNMQYQNYYLTHEDVGYFRGETYPFGVLYEMMDGSYSDVFPVKGKDDYDLGAVTNNNGIYRFPRALHCNPFKDGNIWILKVRFDCTNTIAYLNSGAMGAEWIKANVKNIYFVRGERDNNYSNLKYQGLMIAGCQARLDYDEEAAGTSVYYTTQYTIDQNYFSGGLEEMIVKRDLGGVFTGYAQNDFHFTHINDAWGQFVGKITYDGLGTGNWYSITAFKAGAFPDPVYPHDWNDVPDGSVTQNINKDFQIPLFRGYMPNIYQSNDDARRRYFMSRWWMKQNKYGFFSPDWLFDRNATIDDIYFVKRVGMTNPVGNNTWNASNQFPNLVPHKNFHQMEDILYVSSDREDVVNPNNDLCEVGRVAGLVTPVEAVTYNNWVNHGTDYKTDGTHATNLWWAISGGNEWSNRDIVICPYIGIYTHIDGNCIGDNNFNLDIVNLYKANPANYDGAALDTAYSGAIAQTRYYKISNPIRLNNNPLLNFGLLDPVTNDPFHIYGRGDCFLQRTFIKQQTWNKSDYSIPGGSGDIIGTQITDNTTPAPWGGDGPYMDDGSDSGNTDPIRYTHGIVLGIITENRLNAAMRNTDTSTDFFPHQDSSFGVRALNVGGGISGIESWEYNFGYHAQLGLDYFMAYSPSTPTTQENIRKTRIRHSPINIPYSFIDQYRNLQPSDYKDYDLQFGQIISIKDIEEKLISIQEGAVNQHSINEEALKAPTTPGELTLGLGPILSKDVNILAYIGSQHQHSIKKGFMGVYGVDWKKRAIWRVKLGQTAIGTTSMGAQILSTEKMIEKWIYDLFESYNSRTDILNILHDTPALGEGIVTGHDLKMKKIHFTFLLKQYTGHFTYGSPNMYFNEWMANHYHDMTWLDHQVIPIYDPYATYPDDTLLYDPAHFLVFVYHPVMSFGEYIYAKPIYNDVSRTLSFDEALDFFDGERSFKQYWYGKINNDFYSAPLVSGHGDKVYLHNQSPELLYNGIQYPAKISVYINGFATDTNYSMLTKEFISHDIEGQPLPFSKITWETQFQTGVHIGDSIDDFQTIQFWRNPEWSEHSWKLPIMIQTSANVDEFEIDSSMRGKWMKMTIEFFKKTPGFIKNIVTQYNISKS